MIVSNAVHGKHKSGAVAYISPRGGIFYINLYHYQGLGIEGIVHSDHCASISTGKAVARLRFGKGWRWRVKE